MPSHANALAKDWNEIRGYMGHRWVGIGEENLERVRRGFAKVVGLDSTSSETSMGPGMLQNVNEGWMK